MSLIDTMKIKVTGWYVARIAGLLVVVRRERGESDNNIIDGPFAFRMDAKTAAR
jgi:hypothetical protein